MQTPTQTHLLVQFNGILKLSSEHKLVLQTFSNMLQLQISHINKHNVVVVAVE